MFILSFFIYIQAGVSPDACFVLWMVNLKQFSNGKLVQLNIETQVNRILSQKFKCRAQITLSSKSMEWCHLQFCKMTSTTFMGGNSFESQETDYTVYDFSYDQM